MIDTPALIHELQQRGVALFTGVPDSLLQSFSACLQNEITLHQHIIAANEGNAVALAMGHYLATGRPAVVYMQNAGLGNTVNPLTSLADPEVYGVPMLLVIGWRGAPGTKDEPQHVKQGRITCGQLELLEIPHWVMDEKTDIHAVLDAAWQVMHSSRPAALVVRAGSLSEVKLNPTPQSADAPGLRREEAIDHLLNLLDEQDCVVATTGKTGRELFELRERRGEAQHDFLTVGGMGHTASLALGIALAQPRRRVVCLDGDGSLLMHLGAMPIIGDLKPSNLLHVLLNNRAHESVGGQPTVAGSVDFAALAVACGYVGHFAVRTLADIDQVLAHLLATLPSGPVLLEIHLTQGSRPNLGRPTRTPQENKEAVMTHLGVYSG